MWLSAAICIVIVWVGGFSVKPLHWLQAGSVINGYLFNFTILLRESFPHKPESYSSDTIEQISKEIDLIRMNYLAGLLYQRAGLELPPYNQYLEHLRQEIPACNALGYYSNDNDCFLEIDDAQGDEEKELLEYNWMVWNCLFEGDDRNIVFFRFNEIDNACNKFLRALFIVIIINV